MRKRERFIQIAFHRNHTVYETRPEGFTGADRSSRENHLHGELFPHCPGEALRPARSGHHTDVNLRLAEHSAFGGHDDVASHRELAPSTESESAHGRDQRRLDLPDPVPPREL